MKTKSSTASFLYRTATVMIIVMLALAAMPVPSAHAAACTFTATGTGAMDWSTLTWNAVGTDCSTYPGQTFAGDIVVLANNQQITLNVDLGQSLASITFPTLNANATTLNISGRSVNVTGAVTIPRTSAGFGNTMAVGTGTLNAGSIAFTSAGSTNRHDLTISTGIVTVLGDITSNGSNNISPRIIFSAAGTLNVGGILWNSTSGTLTTFAGSTVNYNAAGDQSVRVFTYANLVLSGSGLKSMAAGTSTTGNLSIAPTGTAKASVADGADLTVNSLTVGGLGTANDGKWGSTASAATYKTDTYFNVATTGVLTVTTDTRSSQAMLTITGPSSMTFGDADADITTSGGSGSGAVTFDAGASTACSIVAGKLHVLSGTGTCDITATKAADSNYSQTTSASFPVTINKANPTASISNTPVTYNGALQTATVACLGGGTATLASGGSGTDAGNYPATVDCAASTNYNAASGLTPTNDPFVISKANQATLSITAPSALTVGSPDADITTSGGSGTGAVTFGAGASTNCSIVANKLHAVSAGASCSITAAKAADTNYNQATSASFPVTISNKIVPTVTASGGPFTYDGASHAATVNGSVAGVVSDVKYNGSSTVPTNAGTYSVTADFVPTDTATYESLTDAAAGSITINKAALTVTANNQTIISGNPDPTFTFGYSGFVNSETSAIIDTAPTCSVAGAHSAPGSYPIVCSGGVDNNYSFSYVNGTLTVNAANNPPTDIALSKSNLDENLAAGTVVGTLSTTDPDLGDTFTYSFCGGTDDASFTISGNSLLSAAAFDFETKNSYSICVRTTDSGALTTTKTFVIAINNVVDTQTFQDVPMSYWAWNFIERLYAAGITGGCTTSPLNYCPTSPVTRAQMAIFLLKGIHGSSYAPPAVGPDTGFTDVAVDYWAAAWIKQLAAEAITGGCGAGIFCPESTVTRAQMAVFLLKATHGPAYAPPAATGIFSDVATSYWAAAWIEQLAAEGITSGCAAGTYCPENAVTRDQMAVFLVKAFNLP